MVLIGKISQTVPSNFSDIVGSSQGYCPGGWVNKERSRLNQARMNKTFAASAIEECFNFNPLNSPRHSAIADANAEASYDFP